MPCHWTGWANLTADVILQRRTRRCLDGGTACGSDPAHDLGLEAKCSELLWDPSMRICWSIWEQVLKYRIWVLRCGDGDIFTKRQSKVWCRDERRPVQYPGLQDVAGVVTKDVCGVHWQDFAYHRGRPCEVVSTTVLWDGGRWILTQNFEDPCIWNVPQFLNHSIAGGRFFEVE